MIQEKKNEEEKEKKKWKETAIEIPYKGRTNNQKIQFFL